MDFCNQLKKRPRRLKKTANDANILVGVDDLEVLNTPESLLLKAVSGESSQDRADRDHLAPWLKFVWESYKQCLELLKNNNKVELLYQQVAKQAFTFCVKYQRKTEFRKLCETIRQHMVQSQKYANQMTSIDLNKPETQNNHLETRLFQLNHAISMELWQEAYKAVEDIYGLMNLSRTKPKPGQMFNYYSKLSLIFWKAGNQLFHAATLQKLFVLLREQKKTITSDELTKISTRLLLATLAIPIPPNRSVIDECLDQDDITQEKLKRLSSLLNLQQPPTRQSLIKDLTKYNVVQHVFPETRDLYKWLEVEFHPLKLSSRVTKSLDFIEANQDIANENYMQYVPAIKEIVVTRLLKQISQIYTSIEIHRFIQLAPNGIQTFHLEKLIVDAAKQLDLQVRINHQNKSLHFGNDLYVDTERSPEGPTIQSMPSEQIRNQLITMTDSLQQAQELIYSTENKGRRDELAAVIANVYRQTCDKHHMDLLRRKQLIEEQKEMYERLVYEREQAELEEKRAKQEEKDRIAGNLNQKMRYDGISLRDRREMELEETRTREAEKEDLELKKQIEQANREKKELMDRLKKEEKKFDHFVRATHEYEIPILTKMAQEDSELRKKFWEEKELERIENLKGERELQSENRDRLFRMNEDRESFESKIHAARREEYEAKLDEFKAKFEVAKENKLQELKEKRKQDRRNAYFKEIEARKKREEEERKKKDDEEHQRKLDEQSEKQRIRDREIEERLRERESNNQRQPLADTEKKDAPYRPRHMQESASGGMDRRDRKPDDSELSWGRGGGGDDRRGDYGRDRGDFGRDRDMRGGGRSDFGHDRDMRRGGDERGGDEGGWRRGGESDRRQEPDRYQARGGASGGSGFGGGRPEGRGFGDRNLGDRDRGFGDRKPERSFGDRGGRADNNTDSWRRGGREEPGEERRPTGGRSYREERGAPSSQGSEQPRADGWTQVRGKK